MDRFAAAVETLASGNKPDAVRQLGELPEDRLSEYFIEHGQQSFHHRTRVLGEIDPPVRFVDGRRPKAERAAKQFEPVVTPIDGYRCRYCGTRVVPSTVLEAVERNLGRDRFFFTSPDPRKKATNDQRHGCVLAFCAVVDHILPWSCGGDSCLTNLVTACWSCNYGKGRYTLEQLGLDDPLTRPAVVDEWRGLTEHLDALSAIP